jgi:hypothetical protein
MNRFLALTTLSLLAAPALAEDLRVDPDGGNSTFSAIFDAKLGERITAMSSSVGCDISYDPQAGTASGTCAVPLTSIRVDNEPTKTEHFQDWATNKKGSPKACKLEARFENVRVGKLSPETPVELAADIPFTVCGRARADGGKEHLTATAVLLPAGSDGGRETIRIRGTVEKFNRDAYHIGPKYTEGWLARVQSLARVVAEEGTIEIAIFAKPVAPTSSVAKAKKGSK